MASKSTKSKKTRSPFKGKIKFNSKKFFFFFCRIVPAAVMVTLFLLPMGMQSISLGDAESLSAVLYPGPGHSGIAASFCLLFDLLSALYSSFPFNFSFYKRKGKCSSLCNNLS